MRIHSGIKTTVAVHYMDLTDTRFMGGATEREVEWSSIRASRDIDESGDFAGRVWLTGHGHAVKKDGTVGRQEVKMTFQRVETLPEDWQERIARDLQTLADRVSIEP